MDMCKPKSEQSYESRAWQADSLQAQSLQFSTANSARRKYLNCAELREKLRKLDKQDKNYKIDLVTQDLSHGDQRLLGEQQNRKTTFFFHYHVA